MKFLCHYCNSSFDIPAPIFDIVVLFSPTTLLEIEKVFLYPNRNFHEPQFRHSREEDASPKESSHRFIDVIIDVR